MPKSKTSIILNFIKKALMLCMYPTCIYWTNKEKGLACIYLLHQYNKEKSRETSRMLEDYAKLKPRKNNEDGGSNRQRFLQALKRSPYIEILACSTANKKYIYLKDAGAIISPDARVVSEMDLFNPNRTPDFTCISEMESTDMDTAKSENCSFFPSDYDPTSEFLLSWHSTLSVLGQGSHTADSFPTSTKLGINNALWVNYYEGHIDVLGPVDSNGNDRPDSMVMFSLGPL